MHRFARLFEQLSLSPDAPTQTRLLIDYLRAVPEADAAWAVALLAGATPGVRLPQRALRNSALLACGLPEWLFDACLAASGDLADTIAQVIPAHPPAAHPNNEPLAHWIVHRMLPMRDLPADALSQVATHWWPLLATPARYLLAKLLSPGWRPPVPPQVLQAALAQHASLDTRTVAQRMCDFMAAPITTRQTAYRALIAAAATPQANLGPASPSAYPFTHAPLIEAPPDDLAQAPQNWWVFWRYEGIPAQLVKRDGRAFLWLADDRLVNDHVPEVIAAAEALPDGTVLEGQLLTWQPGAHRPEGIQGLAARLKRRPAGRTTATRHPNRFLVHDLLEHQAQDLRKQPFERRWQTLGQHLPADTPALALAQRLPAPDAMTLAQLHRASRAEGAHGLVLRRRSGTPWIWPASPLVVLATLIYAQTGGAMRSGYTHYSFATWNRAPANAEEVARALQAPGNGPSPDEAALHLVTVAKVAAEDTGTWQAMLTQCVQKTLTVRNGPVHTVRPEQVFELHVGSISPSARHKCGLRLQEVRVHRTRSDKALQDADSLAVLRAMLDGPGP